MQKSNETTIHCRYAEEASLVIMQEEEEENILGVYVYRFHSPTRYTCSLIPTGAVGILNFNSIVMVPSEGGRNDSLPRVLQKATPEAPVTLLFKDPIPPHQIAWSSEKKCFMCEQQNVRVIVL